MVLNITNFGYSWTSWIFIWIFRGSDPQMILNLQIGHIVVCPANSDPSPWQFHERLSSSCQLTWFTCFLLVYFQAVVLIFWRKWITPSGSSSSIPSYSGRFSNYGLSAFVTLGINNTTCTLVLSPYNSASRWFNSACVWSDSLESGVVLVHQIFH